MTHAIYLSLGSNLGDRLANLDGAVSRLVPGVEHIIPSPVYETMPWGYSDQPDFLNQCLAADTSLAPLDLLALCKDIEATMGRKETFRFGPRLIDLDILFYDNIILETPTLTIPHPRITERPFILIPLADIAPELIHPVLHKTIQQLRLGMDSSSVTLYRPDQAKLEP